MTIYYQQTDFTFPDGLTHDTLDNQLDKAFDALSTDPRVFCVDIVAEGATKVGFMIEVEVPDGQPAPTAALTADLFAVATKAAPILAEATVKHASAVKALAAA